MIYCQEDVPANVVINEALEIAKIYGDESLASLLMEFFQK